MTPAHGASSCTVGASASPVKRKSLSVVAVRSRSLCHVRPPPAQRSRRNLRHAVRERLVPSVQMRADMLDKGDELRDRIEARKHELMSKLHDLKADTRAEARESRAKLDQWLAGD